MKEVAYVNGCWSALGDARVPVEDRGFQFADGVYEVLVAFGDQVFRLEDHLRRLQRSAEAIELDFDVKAAGIGDIIREGVRRGGFAETLVYVQVTRGVAPRAHAFPPDADPTVVSTFTARPEIPTEVRNTGLSVRTVEDIRWARCFIKSIALLPNTLAKNQALGDGYDDAIFATREGEVREATSANVFAVLDGVVCTPPQTEAILRGVTRGYLLECARRLDIPACERRIAVDEMLGAQEVFLSSTAVDVLAVTRLNDRVIGTGRPGPITLRLYDAFCAGRREG